MKIAALLVLCFLCSLQQRSGAQSCNDVDFSGGMSYKTCNALSVLSATLHWTYHESNGTVDIAYRAQQSSNGWVAWAINPDSEGMSGANAFLAFHSGGSVTLYMTRFASTQVSVSDVTNGSLTFAVHSQKAEYSSAGGYYTIYASLDLPGNRTTQNTVWQASTQLSGGVPSGHSLSGDNVMSTSSVNFLSGQSSSAGGTPRLHRKNVCLHFQNALRELALFCSVFLFYFPSFSICSNSNADLSLNVSSSSSSCFSPPFLFLCLESFP